jgi:hypothetical protein
MKKYNNDLFFLGIKMKKKKKKDGLSLKTTTALILIVFLLGLGGTMFYYAFYKVAYVQTFDILVKSVPGNRVGFNADATLHFGKIPSSGGRAEKEMVLLNDWDIPLLLQIRIKGEAAQFIHVQDNNFVLQPREVRKLKVIVIIPDGFDQVGNYTGEAKILYIRP